MKVGFNLLLWTGTVTEEHLSLCSSIKEWGADGVELPMFDPAGSPWQKLKQELDGLGLGRTVVTVLPPGSNLIGEESTERDAAVEHLKRCIDAAAELGAEAICGPLCSPVGRLVGRGPTQDEKDRAAEGLHKAGEHAAKARIILGVEGLNRFETYFPNTQAQLSSLIDAVGLSSVQQMYDTFHANIEEKDLAEAVRTGGARIAHVHISACDRGTPGEDHIDYATTFKALKGIGYDGWLTVESFGHRIAELAGATCIWRPLAPSEEHVVREGCAFIRRAWAAA